MSTTPNPLSVWMICQYYPPEPGAPATRIRGLAQQLHQQGAQVTVLTGIPNHPDGIVPPAYHNKPSWFQEDDSGVTVRRHRFHFAPNKGKFMRVFSMLSFACAVFRRNLGPQTPPPAVIIASSPSFFAVFSAWLLARHHGAKFVFEVRDLWPAIFLQMNILRPGFIYHVLEKLELFLYRRADAIVTVTQSFTRHIAARGIPNKFTIVYNGVADSDYAAAALPRTNGAVTKLRTQLGLPPLAKVVLYIGNHGEAQALSQVVDAARLLVRRTDAVFLFVGNGADKTNLQSYAKGVPNIQFIQAVSHEDVWAYYALADINLVCLKNIPDFNMFIPSKMFEIMAAEGCAVAGLQGEGAEIMKQSGCALVVPPEDPDAMAEAISTLLDDPVRRENMAKSGRYFVGQHFLHSKLAAKYLHLIKSLSEAAAA